LRSRLGDLLASLTLIEEQAGRRSEAFWSHSGGDHGPSRLPLLRAALFETARSCGPSIHFDAHVDTWPDNFGQAYAHGCVVSPCHHGKA